MIFQLKAERNYHIFYQILSNKKPELLGEPCQRSLMPPAPPASPAVQGGPLFLLTRPPTCHLSPPSIRPVPFSSSFTLDPPVSTLASLSHPSFSSFSSNLLLFSFSSAFVSPSPHRHFPTVLSPRVPTTHFSFSLDPPLGLC